MAQKAITAGQIRKIHALKTAIGLDDDAYRTALDTAFSVSTSKALTFDKAQDFIRDLETKAIAAGRWKKWPVKKRFQNLQRRGGMATDAQLRMIEAIWFEVSRAESDEERRKALRKFLFRIAKVSDLRFLDQDCATKVICALKAMQGAKNGKAQKSQKQRNVSKI